MTTYYPPAEYANELDDLFTPEAEERNRLVRLRITAKYGCPKCDGQGEDTYGKTIVRCPACK